MNERVLMGRQVTALSERLWRSLCRGGESSSIHDNPLEKGTGHNAAREEKGRNDPKIEKGR